MNSNNLCDEEYSNSEAWLAEQIFSQLKDFNTEPLKDEENTKLVEGPEESQPEVDGTISSDVLDLEVTEVVEQVPKDGVQDRDNFCSDVSHEQLDVPEKADSDKLHHINQDQNVFQYFGEVLKPPANDMEMQRFPSAEPTFFFPQNHLQIVECANCNCIFDAASFHQHVCDYGEDNNLIIPEPMDQSMASFQAGPAEPPCIRLLRENQIRIRRFLKDELKYDLNAGSASTKKQEGPHECTLCERKFVHASGLSRHMEKHALDLIPTTSSNNANNGCPSINGLKVVIKCTICGRIFFEPSTAFEHFCLHFPGTQEDEQEFGETAEFPYENYLDDALNFLKIESKKPDNKPTAYLKMVILSCVLQCEFCDLLFSEVSYLFMHSACHQPQRPFECCACDIRVFTSKEIFMHWQAECVFARENMKRGCSSQRYYVCNVCENKFGSLEQLHEHRYTAYHFFPRIDRTQGVLLLPCEYCDRVFETANDIVNHFEERHYKKNKRDPAAKYRQYLCDICGKTYTQSSHLWQHLRFHKGVKPFACKEPGCSRRFTIRPDLNDHIRKCHTGERPYHCLVCGRRFLTGSVFYQHRLIHRGERRYGCDECGKRFYRADALKNHLRIHTGEKPYGCLFCTKSFRQRGDRDKHIRARHSCLDANARLMMQMRKLQLEAAARANASSSVPTDDVLMLGNIPFPKSMFQPILPDIDAGQE